MPKTKTSKSLLRNDVNFPTFSDLPDENDVDLTYYDEGPYGFAPSQHWCFLGEIVDSYGLGRILLRVKDKEDQVVTIGLYTDDRGQALAPQIKQGHTVAVLYGEQHGFLDMSVGIRVEEASVIRIIPCSLEQLLKVSDDVAARNSDRQSRCCGSCGQKEDTSDKTHLRLCSRCKQMSYCGEACQKKAWVDGHKVDCKVLVWVQWFAARNWRVFNGYFNF
ncbi:uncharacterized protein EDB93DRAFT_1093524 [Suillus bovinus]|uniref:uncharacterized protein n=1 Tax=Suillus bovinus TaxID=48563 RepID=UPI001B87B617|nr:uncharacterized protein EDB93DRAFT_1093524 [Suillus bovinus]KAG2132907.1 hypothetical protein EDB93DRAFT_1093524 [Suillus bovinus]